MHKALNLNHDVLAKRNHKGLTVKNFHRFLNKSVTISLKSASLFLLVCYAQNNTPIEGTDIFRSIPAIYRELNFPIDISINDLPKLTQNNGQAVLDQLYIPNSSRHFLLYFKLFTEDRRTVHTKYIKNTRHLVVLEPSDIIMTRITIQRNKKKEKFYK